MRKEQIIEQWARPNYNDAEALIRWNKEAEQFRTRELPTQETSLAMRIMYREQMILPGTCGLDVGCGGGRFTMALNRDGMQMHGTDFSPNMIREAQQSQAVFHTHAIFSVENWHTVSLREKGWYKRFDLVLAHMTPAVIDASSFLKLIEASRDWVLMLKPTRWQSPVLDAIKEQLGGTAEESTLDEAFSDAFSLAWLEGYSPKTEYDHSTWPMEMPVEEAVRHYAARLPRSQAAIPDVQQKMKAFLEKSFPDGQVRDETHTQIAALWLHV